MIHLTWPGELPLVFAGLVTFVLHSSLWFLMAYLAARPAAGLGGAGQSRLWKLALVGPLISTALALGLPTGWRPTAFEVQLPAWGEREYVSRSGPALSLPVSGSERVGTGPAAPTWFHRGILFVVGSGLVGLGRLALYLGRRRRYLGRFRDRRWLTEGPAREELLGLVQAARFTRPVRLSVCEQAPSPLVLGSAEICLPERALRELEPPALTAALAHELGHVVRRDNLWLALAASFEALFFFQPLFRRVRRGIEEAAELACDAYAVGLTSSPTALARSIASVASWQLADEEASPVVAMTRSPSAVVTRVRRLLEEAEPGQRPPGRRAPLAVAALTGMVVLTPVLGGPEPLQAAPAADPPIPKATAAGNRLRQGPTYGPQLPPSAASDFGRQVQAHGQQLGERKGRAEERTHRAAERPARAEQRRQEALRRRAEEGVRRAKEGVRRAEEGRRRAEQGVRRAEEGRRRAEEGLRRAELARRRTEQSRRRAEQSQRSTRERRRRANEATGVELATPPVPPIPPGKPTTLAKPAPPIPPGKSTSPTKPVPPIPPASAVKPVPPGPPNPDAGIRSK